MKIKRNLIIALEQTLNGMLETAMVPDLAFKVATDAVAISEVAENIRKSYKQVDGYDEYQVVRGALLEEIAGKSPNGQYQLSPEQAVEFNEKIKEIDLEHKSAIDEQNAYQKEFNNMLEKKIDVPGLEKIKIKEMTTAIEPAKMVVLLKSGIVYNGSGTGDI